MLPNPRFDISSFGKRLRCMNSQTWLVASLLDDDDRRKLLVLLPTRNFAARLCFSFHYLTFFLEILSLKFEEN